jgi:hypothetical protein
VTPVDSAAIPSILEPTTVSASLRHLPFAELGARVAESFAQASRTH